MDSKDCHILIVAGFLANSNCTLKFLSSILSYVCHQTDLCTENTRKCQFRVLPRYKVRSVGDKVRIGDQIQLESVKTEGQFLHQSKIKFGHHNVERDRWLMRTPNLCWNYLFLYFSPLVIWIIKKK